MGGWIAFWKFVLILAAVLYFPLAIVVALRGVGDIRSMFADLKDEERTKPD